MYKEDFFRFSKIRNRLDFSSENSFVSEDFKTSSSWPTSDLVSQNLQTLSWFDSKQDSVLVFHNFCLQKDFCLNLPKQVQLKSGLALKRKSSFNKDHPFDYFDSLPVSLPQQDLIFQNWSSSRPLLLLNFVSGAQSPEYLKNQLLIKFDDCQISLIVMHVFSQDLDAKICQPSVQIQAQNKSKVDFIFLHKNKNTPYTLYDHQIWVKDSSYVKFLGIFLPGGDIRHHLRLHLQDEGSKGDLYAVSLQNQSYQTEHYTHIHHHAKKSESNQLFKSLLNDSAQSIFSGLIQVALNASQVNSSQLNKNLLLSPKAHALSMPQLKIDCDDVKCTHGATIGSISEEELFYLNSRGIPLQKAQEFLAQGFATDLLDQIENLDIQTYFRQLVFQALNQGEKK